MAAWKDEVAYARRILAAEGAIGLTRAGCRRASRPLRTFWHLSKRDLLLGRRAVKVDRCVLEVPNDMAWAFPDGTYYEKNVIHWFERALTGLGHPVVYDIGANYGFYSLKAA